MYSSQPIRLQIFFHVSNNNKIFSFFLEALPMPPPLCINSSPPPTHQILKSPLMFLTPVGNPVPPTMGNPVSYIQAQNNLCFWHLILCGEYFPLWTSTDKHRTSYRNKLRLTWNKFYTAAMFFGFFMYNCSTPNKDRSTVNYYQYLAFEQPYLSCNDYCDWWLFQETFLSLIFLFCWNSFEQSWACFLGTVKHSKQFSILSLRVDI